MASHKKQSGRNKETPLPSGNFAIPQHEQFFTPNDAEYQSYIKLVAGFFEKFFRWKELLAADEYKTSGEYFQECTVLLSENGSSIRPGLLSKANKDEILSV